MPTTLTTNGVYQIVYQEFHEGYREMWRPNGNESVRMLQCAWNDGPKFMYDMLGFPQRLNVNQLSRQIPEQHPDLTHLYAVEADMIQGLGVPDIDASVGLIRFLNKVPTDPIPAAGSEVFGKARFAVTYRTVPYDVRSDTQISTELDRYVERSFTFATEAFLIPESSLQWVSDGKAIQESVPKALYTKELSYRWAEVTDPLPDTAIENCINKVNSTTFDVGYGPGKAGYAAGTLLMIAPNTERKWSAVGLKLWEVTYKFLWRAQGWNKLYRRTDGDFSTVQNSVGGKPAIYDTADFATLFQIA